MRSVAQQRRASTRGSVFGADRRVSRWPIHTKTPRQTPKHDWSSHDADSFGTYAENRRPLIGPRQEQAISNWDPLASQSIYGQSPYPGGNPNPIPNVGFKPTPPPTTDWDPFDLPEAEYR